MVAVASILILIGIVGLIYGIMEKLKAGRVMDAPLVSTGDAASKGPQVAGNRGAISAQGGVTCQQPLISPMSGVPCLYYEIKCTATWKDGDSEKSKEIDKQKVAAQFAIDDGTGPVWVDAREGGDFEPSQSKSETKSTGLIAGITGGDLMFGQYRVSTGLLSIGTKYQVEEKVLPMQQRLYVCGKAAEGGGAITAPSWRALIMSNKTRDDLLASAMKGSKIALIVGASAMVVGIAMGVVSSMMGGGDSSSATATADSAAPEATGAAPADTAAVATNKPSAVVPTKGGTKGTTTKPGTTAAAPAAAAGAAPAAATARATAPPASTGTAAATATPAKTAAPSTAKPAAPPPPKTKK